MSEIDEKLDREALLSENEIEEREELVRSPNRKAKLLIIASIIITSYIFGFCLTGSIVMLTGKHHHHKKGKGIKLDCPSLDKILPGDKFIGPEQFFTSDYRNFSLDVWGGAVKIPSISYDDLKEVGYDDRWLIFGKLQEFLKEKFPLVFEKFNVEYINTYGLLMTLPGKNLDLKPIILMAHQDVVPVPAETISRWTHPPFDGYFDGEFLWGRGSSDDKNSLIAILEAASALVKEDYSPERTIILSFGFDEEASGLRGAGHLSKYLEQKLGHDSVFMILDEGGGIQKSFGSWFALPATGEKGYLDLRVTLTTSGGHSSIPPDHTAIGIISQLITAIEASPYSPDITKANPFYYHLQCLAKESKSLTHKLKKDISNLDRCPASKKRVIKEFEKFPSFKYVMRTSQAVDIINGGLKINALPEQVIVDVNHRVAVESSLDFVKDKLTSTVSSIADKFEFNVVAFGKTVSESKHSKGIFDISVLSELDPAPVTPVHDNPSWNLLGGTLKQVFEDVNGGFIDGPLTVAPSIMTGNTDTRYYWNLTKNIYRFSPMVESLSRNIHAIDEHTSLDGHIQGVAFYYNFLRNINAYNNEQ